MKRIILLAAVIYVFCSFICLGQDRGFLSAVSNNTAFRNVAEESVNMIFHNMWNTSTRADGEVVYRDITLTEAGTLASTLGEAVNDLDSLVVRGPINEEDFSTLWSATFYGRLSVIDLENALPVNETVPANAFFHSTEQVKNEGIYLIGLKKIILPKQLKSIGESAFTWATRLEEIVLPEKMEKIGEKAFLECWSLKTSPLVLPKGLTEIPRMCFYFCVNLDEVVLPSTIQHIRWGGFGNCQGMRSINLPYGLLSIGELGLSGTSLEEVTIPSTCQDFPGSLQLSTNYCLNKVTIENGMRVMPEGFLDTTSVKEIEIPSSVETILKRGLYMCYELETLILPEGVMYLETEALRNCSSLKKIELPSTMRSLGVFTCYDLTSLEEIYCKAPTPPACGIDPTNTDDLSGFSGNITFSEMPHDIPVYVPVGTADLYREANGWSYFTNFIETDFLTSVDGIAVDEQNGDGVYYDLTGMKVSKPIPGQLYIQNGRKVVFR